MYHLFYFIFGEWFTNTLGTCVFSLTARCHTTSFSPHCQTAPEPDFRWAVDRTQRPSQLSCISPDLNLDFWLWGHLKPLVYSALIDDLDVLQQRVEKACQEIRVKPGIFNGVRISVRWGAESCFGMHRNNHTRTPPISQQALIFGHMLTGALFAHSSEYYTPLRPVGLTI